MIKYLGQLICLSGMSIAETDNISPEMILPRELSEYKISSDHQKLSLCFAMWER